MTQFGADAQKSPHRGTMILVFGIIALSGSIGFLCCCVLFGPFPLLGLVPWIMGKADLAKMDAGQMDDSGRSSTNVGRILGMISVPLGVLGCITSIATVLFYGLGAIKFGG